MSQNTAQISKIVSAREAVSIVKSNDRVFFQGAAMTPNLLIDTLCERHEELNNIEIIQVHTHGEAKYTQLPYCNSFRLHSCFVGDNVRKGVNTNSGDYIPVFLSEIHWLFRRNILPLDVAFIQVSLPDKHGYCSLGVSVDITIPAIQTAKSKAVKWIPIGTGFYFGCFFSFIFDPHVALITSFVKQSLSQCGLSCCFYYSNSRILALTGFRTHN